VKKKITSIVLSLGLLSSVLLPQLPTAMAQQNFDYDYDNKAIYSELTSEELETLQEEVGLTEEEVQNIPPHILKNLIKQNAKVLASKTFIHKFDEGKNDKGRSVKSNDLTELKLNGIAFAVKSDRKGYKKFYLYGNFEWLESPRFMLTDKMTIGYPDTAKFFLPMKKGKPEQHENQYCIKTITNPKWDCKTSTEASDWEPGIGVAAEFDLRMGNRPQHAGYISQYVYTEDTESGTINIKFEYGHNRVIGTVGVSYSPFGLSIAPSNTTDVASYGIEFKY
jgi:hypothetical protein